MKKNIFLLSVLLLCYSCNDRNGLPEGILDEKDMIQVLIDIRLAEGKINALAVRGDSAARLYHLLEERVFEKHQVDSLTYRKSHEYYLLNPKKYLKITDAVIDSLKIREQQLPRRGSTSQPKEGKRNTVY